MSFSGHESDFHSSSIQAPVLLWTSLQQRLNPAEWEEVKQSIGARIIDENEDLWNELNSLLEIYNDFCQESEAKQQQRQRHRSSLPEPAGKDLLEMKIKLFVDTIHREKGASVAARVAETEREKQLYEYMLKSSKRPASRSASDGDGRTTPRSTDSRPGSRQGSFSYRPNSAGAIERVRSVFEIDDMLASLREAFHEEKQHLLDEITQIQNALDEESDYDFQMSKLEDVKPTFHELKEFSAKLEKQLSYSGDMLSSKTMPMNHHSPPHSKPPLPFPASQTSFKERKGLSPHVVRREPLSPATQTPTLVADGISSSADRSARARPSSANRLRSLVYQSRETSRPSE